MSHFKVTILTLTLVVIILASDGQVPSKSDTVKANSYTLIFSPTDSVQMTDIFGDSGLRHQVTDSFKNSHERAIFIEKYLAEKFKKYFKANDSTLTLFLRNDKELRFPKWDEEKDAGYNFEHYFSDIDYILLHVQWGEGNDWMLVNRKNGFKKNIIGEPYVSPSSKRILTVNSAMPGYGDSGIELLSVSGDTLKNEFGVLRNWGATGAKWLTDDKVIIEEDTSDSGENKVYEIMLIKH